MHLDLKPFNVMVGPDLVPKLIDFGDAYHRDVCGKSTFKITQHSCLVKHSPGSPQRSFSAYVVSLIDKKIRCNFLRSRMYFHLPFL